MKSMGRFGIKLNETAKHYIRLFVPGGLMLILGGGSAFLAERIAWFAEIWSSKANRIFIIFVLPFILTFIFYQFHSYLWGRKKLIRSFKGVTRFKLQDCNEGEKIRIQGKLRFIGEPMHAPLSQRECAAYTLSASHQVDVATSSTSGNLKSETIWERFHFNQCAKDFLIECGGDYALVRSSGAKMIIQPDTIHDENNYDIDKGGFPTAKENALRANVLEAINVNSRRFTGVYGENIKFEEGVLEEHEQVAVVGVGQWIDTMSCDELASLSKQGVTQVFEIYATQNVQVCLSDARDLLDGV